VPALTLVSLLKTDFGLKLVGDWPSPFQ
jgi:hypothetical protein